MSAVARGPAAPEPQADPPVVHGTLRLLGILALVLGAVAALVAFVTPMRTPVATGVLAAVGTLAIVLGGLVQAAARRTGHRPSGPATAGLMLGVAALGILAVSFVPAAVGLEITG